MYSRSSAMLEARVQKGGHSCLQVEIYSNRTTAMIIMRKILKNLGWITWKEWKQAAKRYQLDIGKHGDFIRMVNPKDMQNPVASATFLTKPGDPVKYACTTEEQKKAASQTQKHWMGNPPGNANCHFFASIQDEMGACGVFINAAKVFDEKVSFNYQGKDLKVTLGVEGADKVKAANDKLRTFVKLISEDMHHVYSFKYECKSGKFMDESIEKTFRKDIAAGQGKSRY